MACVEAYEIMNTLEKWQQFLTPKRSYKINMTGAFVNAFFAFGVWALGMPIVFAHLFLASGVCFIVGAAANFWMMRIQSKK